jgi:hypothetical protein
MSGLRRLWPLGGKRGHLLGNRQEAGPAPAAGLQKHQRATLLEMLPRRSVGAEIGVHLGDFSADILRIVAPACLHLVDPWKHFDTPGYKQAWYGGGAKGGQAEMDERYESVLARFRSEIDAGRVVVHRGFSNDVGLNLPAEHLDWVYIDGDHTYDVVKRDLELFFEKTKPGGYLIGDDYHDGGWWAGGVKKAVDEFVRAYPVDVVTLKYEQFVLRKRQHGAMAL